MNSRLLLLTSVLGLVAFQAFNSNNSSFTWEQYKSTHGKSYSTDEEEQYRIAVYMIAEAEVAIHNAEESNTYSKGLNQFSDLTKDEFKSIYLGYNTDSEVTNFFDDEDIIMDGEGVNWVTKGAVQKVKDQGQCGSCWAFSTVASSESAKFLTSGKLGDFSEQQLVDCSGSFGNQGCNGGLMDNGFKYYASVKKICTEDSYPYTAKDGECSMDQCKVDGFVVTDHTDCSGVSALSQAIMKRPISVAVDAENWSSYSKGIFSNCGKNLDHGVLLAGYTSDYWLVKNSWAASWGENGYIRLAPGNTCGIANQPSYPTGK